MSSLTKSSNKVLLNIIKEQSKEIHRLKRLCHEKDSYFTEMISDGLRRGSSLAAKHMADRRIYKNGR